MTVHVDPELVAGVQKIFRDAGLSNNEAVVILLDQVTQNSRLDMYRKRSLVGQRFIVY